MQHNIYVKKNYVVFAILAATVCLAVIVAFALLLPRAEAKQVGSFEAVRTYTFETIVDTNGEYGGELPGNISGTIVGVTVFRQEPNGAWYPVVLNTVYDNDNIAENMGFGSDRQFGGYFKHNNDWSPIQEHIGKRIRMVIFVRD